MFDDLKLVIRQMDKELSGLPIKKKADHMKKRLENIVSERQIMLKLRRKGEKMEKRDEQEFACIEKRL